MDAKNSNSERERVTERESVSGPDYGSRNEQPPRATGAPASKQEASEEDGKETSRTED